MEEEVVISLQNVSKSFNKELSLKSLLKIIVGKFSNNDLILSNINLEINKGDFVAIVGNNGVGKSTLLKLISGVLTPDKGKISINGKINAIHELTSGFDQELNGYENLELLATLQSITKNEFLKKIEEIISFSELSDKDLKKAIKYYSSGMKTRLAYAFNIAFVKDILLLDEVLAVGDYNFVQKCIKQLKLLTKRGVTILLVTHNITQVEEFISKIYEIENSEINQTTIEAYKQTLTKKSTQLFYVHKNLKLHDISIKEKGLKVLTNELPTLNLNKSETIDVEFNISNLKKPINTRFYAMISFNEPISRYESVDYTLKSGKQIVSFKIDIPDLHTGKYILEFIVFKIEDGIKELLLRNRLTLSSKQEFTFNLTPSIIHKKIKLKNIKNENF